MIQSASANGHSVGALAVLRRVAPGRVRLSVEGLRRNPHRAADAEAALARIPGVRAVSASALTGNALVVYDPIAVAEDRLLAEASLLVAGLNGAVAGANGHRTHLERTAALGGPEWHALATADVMQRLGVDEARGLS